MVVPWTGEVAMEMEKGRPKFTTFFGSSTDKTCWVVEIKVKKRERNQ